MRIKICNYGSYGYSPDGYIFCLSSRLAPVLKTIFLSYHIIVTNLTPMALNRAIGVRLVTIFHQCVISYTCNQSNSDGSVSYHILVTSLTPMALFRAIGVRLVTSIWYDTLTKNCFRDWSQSTCQATVQTCCPLRTLDRNERIQVPYVRICNHFDRISICCSYV